MSNSAPNYLPSQQTQKNSRLAIASALCAIASWMILPIIGALAAIIIGHIAIYEIKNSHGLLKGRGMAIAGLVSGYLQIVLVIFLWQVPSF